MNPGVAAANATPTGSGRRAEPGARPSRRPGLLDSLMGVPAFVRNEWLDVLAANQLDEAFSAPQFGDAGRPVNAARFVFLSPRAQ